MPIALIVRLPAIAQRNVKKAVGPEADRAAIVVGLRFVDPQNFAPAGGIDLVGVGWINPPFGQH